MLKTIMMTSYIVHRNHILKVSLYPKESHRLLKFVMCLTTIFLINVRPYKIDLPILTTLET